MPLSHKNIQFKPALLPTLAALAMIALTLYLSSWQTSRAAQKTALQLSFDARVKLPPVNLNDVLLSSMDAVTAETLRFRTGTISGVWLENAQFVVDNKQHNAKPGYHVITPLKLIEASRATTQTQNTVIFINRGWVPRTRDYPALPVIAPPPDAANYVGVLVAPTKKYLELGTDNGKNALPPSPQSAQPARIDTNQVWQNLDLARIAAATGLDVFPLVMLLDSKSALVKSGAPISAISPIELIETPDAGVDKHRGYAFQWLALAIAIALIWLAVNLKITRNQTI